jgi:hypothetical protein
LMWICFNPFRVVPSLDVTQGSSFRATLGYMIPILSGLDEETEKTIELILIPSFPNSILKQNVKPA